MHFLSHCPLFFVILVSFLGIFCLCGSLLFASEDVTSKSDAIEKIVLSIGAIIFILVCLVSDHEKSSILCGVVFLAIELGNIFSTIRDFPIRRLIER